MCVCQVSVEVCQYTLRALQYSCEGCKHGCFNSLEAIASPRSPELPQGEYTDCTCQHSTIILLFAPVVETACYVLQGETQR